MLHTHVASQARSGPDAGVRGSAEDALLRAMFAARKSVFVDLLKWDVPVLAGCYEVDQFDDPNAQYLILADRDGAHLASARLLPTLHPHILGSFYRSLCEQEPPQGPDIFEITRFCLDRRLCASERRQTRDSLICALVGHALARNMRQYVVIAELSWLSQILAFGWECHPLGLPQMIDGRMLGAISIQIDASTPDRLAIAGIRPSRSLLVAALPRA
ncbi:acyl-homoserine-lactone synthase [Sphingobium yanoikuyae]|jgi:acyl-homoserine lactone synthase|uniref:acyl-homoserine-lactone synthase n=1 Tax=Sphingobium yanoikuyae TaxID=13690 RepID=UPI001376CF2A|nr:acyl-homoserine-lactone synthase [Sphingobium yanoikuyae]NBB39623.1 autoinducer synthase [Sphingobium yanoikuyae]